MKCLIVIATIFAAATADASLREHVNDFVELFPKNTKISEIVRSYLTNDEETRKAFRLFTSEEFHESLNRMLASREFEGVGKFLSSIGLDEFTVTDAISRILGAGHLLMPMSTRMKVADAAKTRNGIAGLAFAILAKFPLKEIARLHEEKLETSKTFASFVEKVRSDEFLKLARDLEACKDTRAFLGLGLSVGFDWMLILDLFATAIGLGQDMEGKILWVDEKNDDGAPPTEQDSSIPEDSVCDASSRLDSICRGPIVANSLGDPTFSRGSFFTDLYDFSQLFIADEKISRILDVYFHEDGEFRGAIDYLASDEFSAILESLMEIEEYDRIVDYLRRGGMDFPSLLTDVREFLTTDVSMIEYLENSQYSGDFGSATRVTRGLRGFFADLKRETPFAEIAALRDEKLAGSQSYRRFLEIVRSEEFSNAFEKLQANEQFQIVVEKLNERGIRYGDLIDLFAVLIAV